jgi:hypothetical protein
VITWPAGAHPATHPAAHLVMTLYVVSVESPLPAWIRWNTNTNLPCFTFACPEGVSHADAKALKERADICCGGTLSVVEASA